MPEYHLTITKKLSYNMCFTAGTTNSFIFFKHPVSILEILGLSKYNIHV